jgi:hypothetical protein
MPHDGGVLEAAGRWAAALRDAGADVVMTERVGVARRRVLERRVPADGGVGVWTLSIAMAIRGHHLAPSTRVASRAADTACRATHVVLMLE